MDWNRTAAVVEPARTRDSCRLVRLNLMVTHIRSSITKTIKLTVEHNASNYNIQNTKRNLNKTRRINHNMEHKQIRLKSWTSPNPHIAQQNLLTKMKFDYNNLKCTKEEVKIHNSLESKNNKFP